MTSFPLTLSRQNPQTPAGYVGRFAPSPSGPLHFGSMVAAVGSYLQARANQGQWLVRMEDIDPPREVAGAADHILRTLESFGLHWDGEVMYQSTRSNEYRAALQWLADQQLTYHCRCTRKQIQQNSQYPGVYQRTCREQEHDSHQAAVRFRNDRPVMTFDDRLQGTVTTDSQAPFADDFIVHRKDGLFAYQLAVVVDDIAQGISEVVRGSDLLNVTLHQQTLFQALGYPVIDYLHFPVVVTEPGKKLSKQNHAAPVDDEHRQQTLLRVLKALGMQPSDEMAGSDVEAILQWAVKHWQLAKVPKQMEIALI